MSMKRTVRLGWLCLGLGWLGLDAQPAAAVAEAPATPPVRVEVEVEEELYRAEPANNGAGPMWCAGSTSLVRLGETVFASGLETLAGEPPLNNCRWVLWRRDAKGWQRVHVDESGRTREPSPLAAFADGQVFLSANPTTRPAGHEGGGPARPELWQFRVEGSAAPTTLLPQWQGSPPFTEHSYRSLAADGPGGELVLFQNIDYTHAEWTFRDARGTWAARGRLKWPWGADYAKPQPIRICYPNVALRGRAVHFFGISDILEPNPAWRTAKRELTGKEWDYEFRRLFHTWTPDITREPFREWTEVAGREKTCGWLSASDLHLEADGTVRVLWTERALDERLRARFFPEARQSHTLNLGVIRDGRLVSRETLLESTEDRPGPVAAAARFHVTPGGRLYVLRHVSGGGASSGNELVMLGADGKPGAPVPIPFAQPFTSFFTATPRAGSAPSEVIDLLGVRAGTANAISYARVRLR